MLPHELLGEEVVTCIALLDGATLTEDAVKSFVKDKLESYKRPERVLFFEEREFPMASSDKVKSSEMKELAIKRLKDQG